MIRPIKDKVLIEYRDRVQGLVVIPDSIEEQFKVADVIAVGPLVTGVNAGAIVRLYEGVYGWPTPKGRFIREAHILGVLEGDVVRPLNDRIIVRREDVEDRIGSIIIPDTAKEKALTGIIISTGEGALINGKRIPLIAKVGNRVLFGNRAGTDIMIDKEPYLIMREEDILVILED